MPKSRKWCFTLNNYNADDYDRISRVAEGARYAVIGKEKGSMGTPHLQGFLYFKNAVSFNSVKNKVGAACHLETAKGTPEQNRIYCTKDGDFQEWGELPMSQKRKGEVEKERWASAISLAKEGKFEELELSEPQIFLSHYRTLRTIQKDFMPDVEDADDVTGIWFWGEPGTGKSFTARQQYPGAYLKMCNKWWDGYQDEEFVIMDDLDPKHAVLGHHLKIWADRYCFIAEIKGGARKIRPKTFIVTSQYSPEQIWENDEETVKAIRRRFTVTKFNKL
jgi:hypothetical protein